MTSDPGAGHEAPETGQETAQRGAGDWRTITAFGRSVTLEVGDLDEFEQFLVKVSVDGKPRWHGYFTDKSPDA